MEVVRGFLPFAFTFATIAWLWYEHYAFFRRFDAHDHVTIALNLALLFVVLFYIYPLKFLFTLVVNWFLGRASFRSAMEQPGDTTRLMLIYGCGFIAMFIIFAALYGNVWRRRAVMRLSPIEVYDARVGVIAHLLAGAVGVLSILIAAVGGDRWAWVAGVSYSLLGPVLGVWGYVSGSRRERLHPEAHLPV